MRYTTVNKNTFLNVLKSFNTFINYSFVKENKAPNLIKSEYFEARRLKIFDIGFNLHLIVLGLHLPF